MPFITGVVNQELTLSQLSIQTRKQVCLHVCMHVCMWVCRYVGRHAYLLPCMHACMHACMPDCMYTCVYVCQCVNMHVCRPVGLSVCLPVCPHVYMYVCWRLRSRVEVLRLMIEILHYLILRTLNYGNYGIFLIMGNAGFLSSTVVCEYWRHDPSGCACLS